MADNVVDVKVRVNAETGGIDVLNAKFKEAAGGANTAQGAFTGLSGSAKNLLGSLGLVASVGGIISFFAASVKGAEEEAAALRRLQGAIEATGGSWNVASESARRFADAVREQTRFSDSQALQTQEKLVRVTGSLASAQTAARLAMNITVRSTLDLAAATQLVTDLINGKQRALEGARREFGALLTGVESTGEAFLVLNEKLAGAAVAESNLTSETEKMKNAFGELSDAIGERLSPIMTRLFRSMADSVNNMGNFGRTMKADVTLIVEDAWHWVVALVGALDQLKSGNLKGVSQSFEELGRNLEETKIRQLESLRDMKSQQDEILGGQGETPEFRDPDGADSAQKLNEQLAAEETARYQSWARVRQEQIKENQHYKKLNEQRVKESIVQIQMESAARKAAGLNTMDTVAQTFAVLNSMGEGHTQGELNRARIILAVEKAIAIARIWSGAAAFGPGMQAMAVAQTALVVAQFAQQSKALGSAQRELSQGSTTSISTPVDDGTGREIIQTGGSSVRGPGGGGGGAGGGGNVITQNFSFNVHFDQLNADTVRPLARALADLVRNNATEGVRLALSIDASATRNAGVSS